jgi:hypothetical protein
LESVQLETTGGEVRIIIGRSDVKATEYVRLSLPAVSGKTALSPPLNGWILELQEVDKQGFTARLSREEENRDDNGWVAAAPSRELRVALLHAADRAEDARYVEAALRALAETSGDTVAFAADAATADWIFWLNNQPPSADVLRAVAERGANLVSDAKGDGATTILSTFGNPPVELLRRTTPAGDDGAAVWSDASGVPVLTVARKGAGRHWQFFSRFHPNWNALPRSSALPAALRTILSAGERPVQSSRDVRRVDASQPAAGERSELPSIRLASEAETVDLRNVIWFFCLALFVVERVLSHRARSPKRDPEPAVREAEPEPAVT